MKYRIIKHDKLNWAIEEWQAGGEIVSRGPYAGQAKVARWKPAKSFHSTLRHAALSLLDQATGDALLTGEAADILSAIKLAEQSVLATLNEAQKTIT